MKEDCCTMKMSTQIIKHAFAEQRLDYQLIRMLNAYGSMTFTLKAQSLFFYGFKKNFCESSID